MYCARVNILANSDPRGVEEISNIQKRGRNKGFLLFSTKKQWRNKEKEGEKLEFLAKIFTPASIATVKSGCSDVFKVYQAKLIPEISNLY